MKQDNTSSKMQFMTTKTASAIRGVLRFEQIMFRSTASRLATWLMLFCVACALNHASLHAKMPYLDEILYLHQGKMLIEKNVFPPLCANPLPTFVNGLLYIPFSQHSDALAQVSTLRRYLTLAIILAGTWYAGSCVAGCRGAFMSTLLVSTLPFARLTLINSTDAFYCAAIMAGLGPMIVVFTRDKAANLRLFLLIGACLSAAYFSRSDGVIVAGAWFALAVILIWTKYCPQTLYATRLCTAGAVFVLPIIGYCCVVGAATGDFHTGLSERTYGAFLQGENVLYAGRFLDTAATKLAGGHDYGTYEQNNRSVLTAIARHPEAFAERLRRIPANFLTAFVSAWGGYALGMIACLMLAMGLFASVKSSNLQMPLVAAAVFAPLLLYPLTFYRPGYVAMNVPAFCVLVVGAGYSCRPNLGHNFRIIFTVLLLFGVTIAIFQTLRWEWLQASNTRSTESDLSFVKQLNEKLPKGETVVSLDPSLPWNAGLEHDADEEYIDKILSISHEYDRIHSSIELVSYMHSKHLRYILIDPTMREYYPQFAQLIDQCKPPMRVIIRDSQSDRQLYSLTAPIVP